MYGAAIVRMSCSPKGFGDVKNSFPSQLRFRVERFFPQVSVCRELC